MPNMNDMHHLPLDLIDGSVDVWKVPIEQLPMLWRSGNPHPTERQRAQAKDRIAETEIPGVGCFVFWLASRNVGVDGFQVASRRGVKPNLAFHVSPQKRRRTPPRAAYGLP